VDRWRVVSPLAELAGTAIVIGVLVSARVVAWHPDSPVAERVHGTSGRIAIVAGLTGLTIVAIARSPLGRLSGAHLNPAVTVGFGLQGMVAPFELVAYPIAQVGGAVLGAITAREAWGRSADLPHVARGVAQPGEGWTTTAVLGGEALVTALLLFIAFAVLSRHSTLRSASFVVPGALVAAVCVFAQRTGAGFNPARVLGPDVSAGRFPGIGTSLVGTFAGAGLASLVWRLVVRRTVLTPKLDHHPGYPCFFRLCRLHPTAV
jgi:aquaporin Z